MNTYPGSTGATPPAQRHPALDFFLKTIVVILAFAASLPAAAQLTTGRISGQVAEAEAGVSVSVTNPSTGFTRDTQTRADGTYVFSGLQPGTYIVSAAVDGEQFTREVRVQVAQNLVVDLGAEDRVDLGAITITGDSAMMAEVRTSAVTTNVTTEQIEMLPQGSRNFLNFARLAPGVRVSRDEFRVQFSGGATNAQGDSLAAGQTNVFIDGVSLKSNIQQGGIVGQDASRGNPFSQLALQEFQVLTQNFKAEFEQAGSSIITAVTKSGSNEFESEFFGLHAPKAFREKTFFQERDDLPKPDFSRSQFGGSLSGPIIKNKLFFFVSYEGRRETRNNTVTPGTDLTPEQRDDLGFDPAQFSGTLDSPFREHLGFAKINWDISARQTFELSTNIKRTHEVRDFGGLDSLDRANNVRTPVASVRAEHQYFGDRFMNELSFDWRRGVFDPDPVNSTDPELNFRGVINLGGRSFQQTVIDETFTLRNNITFTDFQWNGNHVVKTGFRVARNEADVEFGAFINPQFTFQDEPADNLDFSFPAEARLGVGDPNIDAENNQIGVFLQDDWDLTAKLQLNLGVRWDVETNMNNKDFVTPDDAADTMRALEAARAMDAEEARQMGLTEAPDAFEFQAEDFISTGNNRDPYLKAIQPRLGINYDVFGDEWTVLFAGWGRAFDRTLFRVAAEESVLNKFEQRIFRFSLDGQPRNMEPTINWNEFVALAAQSGVDPLSKEGLLLLVDQGFDPGREIRVVDNDLKPPRSDQFSAGIRQKVELFDTVFQTSATYSHIRTKDDIAFFPANRSNFDSDDDGRLDFLPTPDEFGNFFSVIAGVNGRKTRFNALYLTLDKPYTQASGWGFNIAYTLAFAKEAGTTFNFDWINPKTAPFFRNAANERHRIVFNGIVDLPWGIRMSTLAELGSGQPFQVVDLSNGFGNRIIKDTREQPGFFDFKQVDVRLQKDIELGGDRTLSLFVEAINLFNTDNIGGRNGFIPFQGENLNFGQPTGLAGPPREVQAGGRITF